MNSITQKTESPQVARVFYLDKDRQKEFHKLHKLIDKQYGLGYLKVGWIRRMAIIEGKTQTEIIKYAIEKYNTPKKHRTKSKDFYRKIILRLPKLHPDFFKEITNPDVKYLIEKYKKGN
jgi:hypothetical protein